ncbi:hypothetical protein C8Q76DRAFT_685638 [Earliella scabrosa]|nr:hypothetical protein C8Q76DRAFT_685638 [Earliella scabrosa]
MMPAGADVDDPLIAQDDQVEHLESAITSENFEKCLAQLKYLAAGPDGSNLPSVLTQFTNYVQGVQRGVYSALDISQSSAVLDRDPDLRSNMEAKKFELVLRSDALRARKTTENAARAPLKLHGHEKEAATNSWNAPYEGSADILRIVLGQYMQQSGLRTNHYARYAAFTQSSGTGKSRMNDELAKTIVYLPINLGQGDVFPPGDPHVISYLDSLKPLEDQWTVGIQAFLSALFTVARERLHAIKSEIASSTRVQEDQVHLSQIACRFREHMNAGMQFDHHGEYRTAFYAEVTQRSKVLADQVMISLAPKDSPTPEVVQSGKLSILPDGNRTLTSSTGTSRAIVIDAAMEMLRCLAPPNAALDSLSEPLVVVCFDEAHMLTVSPLKIDTGGLREPTLFGEFRRSFRLTRPLPIFFLFLSTVGSIEQFYPLPQYEVSSRLSRMDLNTFPPISYVQLHSLSHRFKPQEHWELSKVASTAFMTQCSRPLFRAMYAAGNDQLRQEIIAFASRKLLCNSNPIPEVLTKHQLLACIGVRIPFQFKRSRGADAIQRALVSDHLRLLEHTEHGFTSIITTAPSEPVVAEAAYRIMVRRRWAQGKLLSASDRHAFKSLQPIHAFALDLQGSHLDLGTRAEYAAAHILLDARDRATTFPLEHNERFPGESEGNVRPALPDLSADGATERRIITVSQFLKALMGSSHFTKVEESLPRVALSSADGKVPLKTAFADGFIYFTHFIPVENVEMVNQEYLFLALSRGAAIICQHNETAMDIITPVLIGNVMKKENVTGIFYQIKNNRTVSHKVQEHLFLAIDPYERGIFDANVENPPPIIRMVFALAPKTSSVSTPDPAEQSVDAFTAYDIWCAGALHDTFDVIAQDEEDAFAELLLAIRNLSDTAGPRDPTLLKTRRGMRTAAGRHVDHFEPWADLSTLHNIGHDFPLRHKKPTNPA